MFIKHEWYNWKTENKYDMRSFYIIFNAIR